jgi:hypothetical protein
MYLKHGSRNLSHDDYESKHVAIFIIGNKIRCVLTEITLWIFQWNNSRGKQILNLFSENPGNPKTSPRLVLDFRFTSIGLWPRHITHWHKLPSSGIGKHLIWCTHLSYSHSLGILLICGLTNVQWLSTAPSKVSKRLGAFLAWRWKHSRLPKPRDSL